MMMRTKFIGLNGLEFGEVSVGAALVGFVVEALEMIGHVGSARTLGQPNALVFPDDSGCVAAALIYEEVVEPNAEDESDAQKRGQRGVEFVALELGEECRGESGVLTELDETHAFLEAQGAKFGADLVRPKIVVDGLVGHGGPVFPNVQKTLRLFSRGAHQMRVTTKLSR